jgi:hypothetical protein
MNDYETIPAGSTTEGKEKRFPSHHFRNRSIYSADQRNKELLEGWNKKLHMGI